VADAARRDLERLAAAGDEDAERRHLQEQIRSGELTDERLRLAAYCDHPIAKQLSPVPEPERAGTWLRYWESARRHLVSGITAADADDEGNHRSESYAKRRAVRAARFQQIGAKALELLDQARPAPWLPDPFSWIQGLKQWGDEVSVRAGVAGARLREWPPELDAVLVLVEAWLQEPVPKRLASIQDALQGLAVPENDDRWGERIVERVAELATAREAEDDDLWHCLYDLSRLVGSEALDTHLAIEKVELHLGAAYDRDAWLIGQSQIHTAIRAALVPWALGASARAGS
jgi:hypothetical protein